MKRLFIVLTLVLAAPAVFALADTPAETPLWPEIEPFETGYLKVSDIHELYYEQSGNPDGKPVFVLHGGPGGHCSPYMRRFFDPEKFLIVMHDQRGAGISKPFAETEGNTTPHLVEDIARLRKHLGIDKKIILFGGSWGSTLALAYAQTYPDHVEGMLMRGVFAATKAEIDHFYHGGVRTHFPEVFDRLVNSLPDPDRRPIPAYLLELLESDDKDVRDKYAAEWARYEIKIAALNTPDARVEEILESFDPLAFARLENHYMANGCFLEEGQLLRDAGKLRDIKVIMVNGRYDVICPPITAYKLAKKIPDSRLIIAEGAGHWMGEPSIQSALLGAARDFE